MRRELTAGAVAAFVMSTFVALFAPAAGAQDAAPSISVAQAPVAGEAGCLPAQEGASASITETATEVIVTISARYAVCGDVTAAVYAMPDNRIFPWPQSKREAETFRIGPGTTVVRFTKGCEPQQFDLVTGDTPQTIRPDTGPMHGPLLFTVPWTGIQHWNGCVTPTTSTTTTSTTPGATTSSTTTTTTTIAANVLGTSTTTTPTVAGVTQTRPDGTSSGGTGTGSALATTGTDMDRMAKLGVLLLALGGTFALVPVLRQPAGRRRPARPGWLPSA